MVSTSIVIGNRIIVIVVVGWFWMEDGKGFDNLVANLAIDLEDLFGMKGVEARWEGNVDFTLVRF